MSIRLKTRAANTSLPSIAVCEYVTKLLEKSGCVEGDIIFSATGGYAEVGHLLGERQIEFNFSDYVNEADSERFDEIARQRVDALADTLSRAFEKVADPHYHDARKSFNPITGALTDLYPLEIFHVLVLNENIFYYALPMLMLLDAIEERLDNPNDIAGVKIRIACDAKTKDRTAYYAIDASDTLAADKIELLLADIAQEYPVAPEKPTLDDVDEAQHGEVIMAASRAYVDMAFEVPDGEPAIFRRHEREIVVAKEDLKILLSVRPTSWLGKVLDSSEPSTEHLL